jgi:hypothetical protein
MMVRMVTSLRNRRPAATLALALLVAIVALAPVGRAQDLQRLLPAETVLALGLRGLDDAGPLLSPFIDPWVELGVGEALTEVLGGLDPTALLGGMPLDPGAVDTELTLPGELEGLELMDLLGREAWLGMSVSPFNPLPALTLLARIDGETGARFGALLDRERAAGALELTEGALRFVQVETDGFPLAAALDGDLLALSSNPDVLRGVLRLRQGSTEPSFGTAAGAAATLGPLVEGPLGEGELLGFLDLGPLARALSPLAAGIGFDASIGRLVALLETLGPIAGVTRLSESGTVTATLRRLEPGAGDAALVRLLTAPSPAPRELLDWVPAEALAVTVTGLDVGAWWAYLADLVGGLRELGVPDLNRTVADVLGVDLGRDLFGWTAPGVAIVQTGVGELTPIAVAADDLLGESVIGLRTSDPAAAEAGLARLLVELTRRVSLFADPFAAPGATAQVAMRERDVDGVTLLAYDVLPGLTLSTAVAGGVAWIGTSEAGLEAVLRTGAAGGDLSPAFAAGLAQVPDGVDAFTLSDDRASLAATGDSLAQQVQLLAGFAGGGIDFDAVDRATDALQAYLDAIAPRFGGTVSWSVSSDDGLVRSEERISIDLR